MGGESSAGRERRESSASRRESSASQHADWDKVSSHYGEVKDVSSRHARRRSSMVKELKKKEPEEPGEEGKAL